jgi:hypothetical protein
MKREPFPRLNGAIDERKRSAFLRELLPAELEFVKIGIEQRARDRVQFPVMIMRTPCEVGHYFTVPGTLFGTRGPVAPASGNSPCAVRTPNSGSWSLESWR